MAAGYQEWEYKIVWKSYGQESSDGKVRNKLSTRGFNELGKEGWELINIHNNDPQDTMERFTQYYFKKEIK